MPKKGVGTPKLKEGLDVSGISYRSYIERTSMVSTVSKKRQMTIEEYIGQYFGLQFFNLVLKLASEQQADDHMDNGIKGNSVKAERQAIASREKRFKDNRAVLNDPDGFEMPMPQSIDKYPMHLKEVFKYLQNTISSLSLVDLEAGVTSDESLINVYFKILEKINLVLLKANEFLKVQ